MPTYVKEKTFNIKSVAIIGAGPSGIASAYELTRTLKDGKSLFGTRDISEYEKENKLAFEEVVVFERNSSVGGVWSKSAYGDNNNDPELPDFNKIKNLSNPSEVYSKSAISNILEKSLRNSSFANPIKIQKDDKIKQAEKFQWKGSAAYNGLFTNVPNGYMSFSFDDLSSEEIEELKERYPRLSYLQNASDVSDYLERVAKNNHLEKYIRFNTNVERVRKLENGKWEITANFSTRSDGKDYSNWYKQEFDAVIIGNGKTVPVIPELKNLQEFTEENKDKVIVTLAKAVKNPEFLQKRKKLLFIGSSVSSIDLVQYAFPRDLDNPSIFISRRRSKGSEWTRVCGLAKGIVNKPEIDEFLPGSQGVRFKDGSIETGFDTVIIATGYHIYYPFLDEKYLSNNPGVLDFYKYTFSSHDPTLALVGNTYAGFFFNRVEIQAAALASVWSNFAFLPDKEEYVKKSKRINNEIIPLFEIKKEFMDPLMELTLPGRIHPFDANPDKYDYIYHMSRATSQIQSVFFDFRNGTLNSQSVFT